MNNIAVGALEDILQSTWHVATARILLVDDEPVILKLLEAMLRSVGFENLVTVQDSRDALRQYEAAPTDLVVLDIDMPHMDGYDVMQAIRNLNDPIAPPIIVLTARTDRETRIRALEAGARDFLIKPFDRPELLMRVRNLLDAHVAHRMVGNHRDVLADMVRRQTVDLRHGRLDALQRLGKAAEYRDEETGNHIMRMSHAAALLAGEIGWSDDQCEILLNAAPMHDIGKIGIPDAILLKPGKLTPGEWESMKCHTQIGAELLDGDSSELIYMGREIALCHHEKWDGSGYPHGLAGEDIPLAARICALADVFDALTSKRPYKPAWSVEQARDHIASQAGKHFDPSLVPAFLAILPQIQDLRQRFED